MGKRILVIDDDEAIRKSFSLALEDTGYFVNTVESGEKGIEEEREQGYDLIFLDFKMPGLNGVETMRELRKIDQNVPVYIVTSFHKEFFDQLKEAQTDDIKFEVLQKPIGSDKIIMLTKAVLDGPVTYV